MATEISPKETGISFSGIFNSCGLSVTLCGNRTMNLPVGHEPEIL